MEFTASNYSSFLAFKKKYRRHTVNICLATLILNPGMPILLAFVAKDADFPTLLGMASITQLFLIILWVWIYHHNVKFPIRLDSTGIRITGKQIPLRDIATVEIVSSSDFIFLRNHNGKTIKGIFIEEVGDLEEFLRILSSLGPEIKIIRK